MANAIRTGVTVLDFRHVAHHSQHVKLLQSNIFNAEKPSYGMTKIEASTDIDAPIEKVWDIVSDLDSEPKFWKGTKQVKNITKEGNFIKREVTIAFRDQKCIQEVTLYPKQKIEAKFTEGIIDGTKTITLTSENSKTQLDVVWEIKLSGMMGMFTGMVKRHIRNGTEQALQNIKKEVEC